ncbi:MAG: TIGR03013 family XrtA/PEP-CTERM system glycosyltransferase [Candidatus Acidiferrum sp.]
MLRIGGQRIPARVLGLIAADAALTCIALLLAIGLRFRSAGMVLLYLRSPYTVPRFLVFALTCALALYYNDLYDGAVISRRFELYFRMFQALGGACIVLAILYYFFPDWGLGRGVAGLAAIAVLLLTLGWRVLWDRAGHLLSDPERILILGTGAEGISLVREILERPELHMKVVGFLDEKGENIGLSLVNPGIIGAASDVEKIVQKEKIDRVILSLMERRGGTPVRQLLNLKFAGVGVEDAHGVYEKLSGRIFLKRLSPSWLILSDGFRKSPFQSAMKRSFDLVISSILLILTMPVMVLVALAIWLETGSPILFRQNRTGMHGKEFEILKFRSMRQDAEKHGPQWAATNDDRITRVGRFIRNSRLDELPQLINVFRGDMSLVGPRPERPVFCAMLEEKIPFFAQRHSVRPGITGWAQIKYQYGASIEDGWTKLEYELFYIKHMSLMLDLAILFETVKVVFSGRGAK